MIVEKNKTKTPKIASKIRISFIEFLTVSALIEIDKYKQHHVLYVS